MNQREFIDRLILAGNEAREFAMSIEYVTGNLPNNCLFSLYLSQDPQSENESSEVKLPGGRILLRKNIKLLSPVEAGKYLWVDGSVPEWVNVCAIGYSNLFTEIELVFTSKLVEAKPEIMWPDLGMAVGNNLVPFRIRGPSISDWEKAKKNA